MLLALALVLTAIAQAQPSVQIYSEFRRVDPSGRILKQDQGGTPREILSPGMVRNAYHTYRVVIDPPKDKWYTLHISQNPDDAVSITLYRELPVSAGSPYLDRLQKVKLPVQGKGAGRESYLLDVWVPGLAPSRRIRLEAQLNDGTGWIIAPMEVRILAGIAPQLKPVSASLPSIEMPSDTAARQALREYVCDVKPQGAPPRHTVRDLIRRNAMQDVAIARSLQVSWGREPLRAAIVKAAGGGDDVAAWCSQSPQTSPLGPEWYLRVRDFLYREASH
jgi:hypothetical protein